MPTSPPPRPLQPPALPLTFRQELVPHIFRAIEGGWSCALVGLPGVGLSNLLRFICEPRVVAHYLGPGAADTLLVYVEVDRLLDNQDIHHVLARQISISARAFGWPKADLAALRSLPRRSAPSAVGLEAEDALTASLDYVCGPNGARQPGRRLVFAFDEFDQPFVRLPAADLRRLRALRDDHKYQLAYLVATRSELAGLGRRPRPGEADVSKFTELFDHYTFPVRPYRPQDATSLIARKTIPWAEPMSSEQTDKLYRATGGHAKLLVAGLIYLAGRLHLPWPNIERGLLADGGLADICRELWDGLDAGEQAALGWLAQERRSDISSDDMARLQLRGLAVGGPEFIFSSVLEAYVNRRQHPAPAATVAVEWRNASKLRDPQAKHFW